MTPASPPDDRVIDEPLKRDLRATLGLNLAMAGVWLADAQLAALVDALVARLDGERRLKRLHAATPTEDRP